MRLVAQTLPRSTSTKHSNILLEPYFRSWHVGEGRQGNVPMRPTQTCTSTGQSTQTIQDILPKCALRSDRREKGRKQQSQTCTAGSRTKKRLEEAFPNPRLGLPQASSSRHTMPQRNESSNVHHLDMLKPSRRYALQR